MKSRVGMSLLVPSLAPRYGHSKTFGYLQVLRCMSLGKAFAHRLQFIVKRVVTHNHAFVVLSLLNHVPYTPSTELHQVARTKDACRTTLCHDAHAGRVGNVVVTHPSKSLV